MRFGTRRRLAGITPLTLPALAALLPGPTSAVRGQTTPAIHAKRYRVTVWVLRPDVRRVPSEEELKPFKSPWRWVGGLDGAPIPPDDQKILRHLEKSNPVLKLGKFTEKLTAVIEPDQEWTAPLKGTSKFQIKVVETDREGAIGEVFGANEEEAARYRTAVADKMLIHLNASINELSPEQQEERRQLGRSDFNGIRCVGYRGLEPSNVRAVTFGLAYHVTRKDDGPGKSKMVVRHTVRDLVLYSIEPLRD